MTSTRAILVSEGDILPEIPGERRVFRLSSVVRMLKDYDNAGDQPRIQWCVEHGIHAYTVSNHADDRGAPACPKRWSSPCRVVTAIIVPLEEDA